MQIRLVAKTEGYIGTEYEGKTIDEIIVGIARLSSSREINELFTEGDKLLRHCILNQHWSIMEMANLTFEVVTSRAMGREFIRHKSISVQEFSQRYQIVTEFEPIEIRFQSENNRQSSTTPMNDVRLYGLISDTIKQSENTYRELLDNNCAKESARLLLPETTQTKMYFNGNIRSWISFLNQRLHNTAQKEIRLIAEGIRDKFIDVCPIISKSLFNFEDAYNIHIMERIVLEKYGLYKMVKENNYKKIK
jgi:thymidylate synthase (FAD)